MRTLTVGLVFVGCAALAAQDARLVFEVASVRPAAPRPVGGFMPGAPGSPITCPISGCGGPGTGTPERITFVNVSLRDLIRVAYDVGQSFQIEAPAWLGSVRFDIVANVPAGATRDEADLMLQNLLADRFQLKVHRTTRELPVFVLVLAQSGSKLEESAGDRNARAASERGRGTIGAGARRRFEIDDRTMAQFADILASEVDRPVIDRTGLAGRYDIRLEFAQLRRPDVVSPDQPSAPELFTALTEQLGLELESARGPVPVLVVDNVSRQPTEN